MTNIIKVRFLRDGQPSGREYTYYTPEPVEVGDAVSLESRNGTTQGIVTQIDVPEAEIEPFKDKAKSIIGKYKPVCERCEHFTAVGEGDHLCIAADIPRTVMSAYSNTEEYAWCKGSLFKKGVNQ